MNSVPLTLVLSSFLKEVFYIYLCIVSGFLIAFESIIATSLYVHNKNHFSYILNLKTVFWKQFKTRTDSSSVN